MLFMMRLEENLIAKIGSTVAHVYTNFSMPSVYAIKFFGRELKSAKVFRM
jgi:hypothetical protein